MGNIRRDILLLSLRLRNRATVSISFLCIRSLVDVPLVGREAESGGPTR